MVAYCIFDPLTSVLSELQPVPEQRFDACMGFIEGRRKRRAEGKQNRVRKPAKQSYGAWSCLVSTGWRWVNVISEVVPLVRWLH